MRSVLVDSVLGAAANYNVGGGGFISRTGEIFDTGETFFTSRNPPAGDSISVGGELCKGETLFHDTGYAWVGVARGLSLIRLLHCWWMRLQVLETTSRDYETNLIALLDGKAINSTETLNNLYGQRKWRLITTRQTQYFYFCRMDTCQHMHYHAQWQTVRHTEELYAQIERTCKQCVWFCVITHM